MGKENIETKKMLRVKYEVAAITGLCSNSQCFYEANPSNKPHEKNDVSKYIATLAKRIADEMLRDPDVKKFDSTEHFYNEGNQ